MAELIVALDFDDARKALDMASRLRGLVSWVKVGLELFIAAGPPVVHSLKKKGYHVFLDFKLHDIPNTVRGATLAAAAAGADIVTVHLAGGKRMCRAAVEASSSCRRPPGIFGITVLTSLEEGELPGCAAPLGDIARDLADMAAEWGLSGVVCSGREASFIKNRHPRLLCLTPGIRPEGESLDDQRRIMSPAQAVAAGADFLVVGRPITRAGDPAAVAAAVIRDMRQASG